MAAGMGKTQLVMRMKMVARGGNAWPSKSYKQSACSEINKVVGGSNIQWRGKLYAASVASSDIPSEAQRGRRRVSKDERQAMVESYVNKYREMNAGKFPNKSAAKKQVGGSYYTVRKIIQELEHKSKMSSLDSSKGSPSGESKVGGSQMSSGAEKTLSGEVVKPTTPGSHSDFVARQSNLLKGDAEAYPCFEKPKDDVEEEALLNDFDFFPAETHLLKEKTEDVSHPCLISGDGKKEEAQVDHSGFAVTENRLLMGETKKVLPPCPENANDNKKEQAFFEDLANVDGPESRVEQYQGSIELDKVAKDISTRQTKDEIPKKSSLWGSLKSFADGIINVWRKM